MDTAIYLCYQALVRIILANHTAIKGSKMKRFARALRVSLNIHPNEKSSVWNTWPLWIEF
jgi:hypothetical protein